MRDKRGFTLLEVMVALAVLAIISGPLLQTFVTSAHVGRRSYDLDKAGSVAVATLEELKGYSLAGLTDTGGFTPNGDGGYTDRNDYYNTNWNRVATQGESAFQVVSKLSTQSNAQVEQSYITTLGSGADAYYTEALYSAAANLKTVTVDGDSTSGYEVSCDSALLQKSTDSAVSVTSSVAIPREDVSGGIPIVIDTSSAAVSGGIALMVNNQSDVDANIYIYGDQDGSKVSIELSPATGGGMNVNRMSVGRETLNFNKLALSVEVFRTGEAQPLVSYTTMLYFAG